MPKTTKSGKPKQSELPSTLQRSGGLAQRTYAKTHDSAVETYDGNEQRANRAAWGAVKHTHEKVGDHWAPKENGKKGPSDARAAEGGLTSTTPTKGGVDANATKEHLLEVAKKLGIPGRSDMKKKQLVDAIQQANDRATAKARTGGSAKRKQNAKKKQK